MLWLIFCIISALLMLVILDWCIIGFAVPDKRIRKRNYEKEYILKEQNRMAYQKTTECSGFSTAYVLRSFGMEADGNDIYAKISRKMKNGAVLPRTLKRAIQGYGYDVKYVKGSLETIKADLSERKRVIVLVKTRLDKNWLHYVSIVGYDEENIFIAESLDYLTNCEEQYYNRKLTNHEFLKFWDTREWYMPFYKNTYLVIDKKRHFSFPL